MVKDNSDSVNRLCQAQQSEIRHSLSLDRCAPHSLTADAKIAFEQPFLSMALARATMKTMKIRLILPEMHHSLESQAADA